MRSMLFLGHRFPYPPVKGEKIRAWNLIRHFAKSYRIHLGCLVDDPTDFQHQEVVRPFCADLACFGIDKRWQKVKSLLKFRPGRPLMLEYNHHPGLKAWVDATMARVDIDIVYIYSTAMAPYVLPINRHGVILDMMDIDSEKWREYGTKSKFPMSAVWAREGRTLLAYEREAARQCDATLLVSDPECRRLVELAPELAPRLHAIEQGVDLERFRPDIALPSPYDVDAPQIVFTGNMDYWPNADAAIWFAREILPLLRARQPAPHFTIVGANPGPEVRALTGLAGVSVTGRVDDVRPYVAHAAVSVSPLRIARGIQNKVLEAMALGRPVVASPQAFEGVRAEAGRDLLVGDDAAAIAARVAEVLDGEHSHLGAAAREVMVRNYAWSGVLAKLDSVLESSMV
ncbi:MAG TPA: TIGR03087 family PEP-CTERM/XrtA system glycosyltransferase [Acetobacteraceae bacterium]